MVYHAYLLLSLANNNKFMVKLLKIARVQRDSIAISVSLRGRPQDLKNLAINQKFHGLLLLPKKSWADHKMDRLFPSFSRAVTEFPNWK
jgi:hypothetical protein